MEDNPKCKIEQLYQTDRSVERGKSEKRKKRSKKENVMSGKKKKPSHVKCHAEVVSGHVILNGQLKHARAWRESVSNRHLICQSRQH